MKPHQQLALSSSALFHEPIGLIFSREGPQGSLLAFASGNVVDTPTQPVFSPLQRNLRFFPDLISAVDAADDQLFLVDLKSGKRTQIAGPAAWPTWSKDSQYIYFVRWGTSWIFRVRVPEGQEEKVLEVPFRLAALPFKLAQDGSVLLLRDHGRYDIYSLSLTFR